MPSPRDNCLSVFRTIGLRETAIWTIGRAVLWRRKGASLCGRADFLSRHVSEVHLAVRHDWIPPRHASVSGWPPVQEKARAKHLAQTLAAFALLKPLPDVEANT